MSNYTAGPSEDWLQLKHNTNKPRAYGFSCGGRDSDWDFTEHNPNHYHMSSGPMQLLNNPGGFDSGDEFDEEYPCEVIVRPYTAQYHAYKEPQQPAMNADSGSMDVDMEVEMSDAAPAQGPTAMQFAQQPMQQQQQQQQQQFFQQSANPVNKRKRTCEMAAAEQFAGVDLSKRMRVGA